MVLSIFGVTYREIISMKYTLSRIAIHLFYMIVLLISAASGHASELTLAVANSTCNAIKQVGDQYSRQYDVDITYICKSSGRLAKGLRGKAIDADIYISANQSWMDYLVNAGLVSPKEITRPWGNSLVVSTRIDNPLVLHDWDSLASDKVKTILIGDPGTAPFGRYTKEALQATELWKLALPKIETKKHITLLADTLAESDDNTVGILFVTNVTNRLKVIYSIDTSWHSPILYYMAPIGNRVSDSQVRSLLEYIQSPDAQAIFKAEGFELPPH